MPASTRPKSKSENTSDKHDLDYWLDEISVGEVDEHHNEANGGKLTGILGWHYVVDQDGVNAYFSTETLALRHRLDLINRKLNG